MATVTFDGFGDLESALKELDNVTQKQIIRKAARIGMKPVFDEVKLGIASRWGDRSGALQDSVKMRVNFPRNATWADVVASVGVFRIRSLEPLAEAYYPGGYIGAATLAYWWEHGIQPHALGKKAKRARGKGQESGGMHPGQAARPVLRPTMDANVEIVTARTGNVLAYEIERAFRKQSSKK